MTPEEIAALKAGDKITVEVEKPVKHGGDDLTVRLVGGATHYFGPRTLAHATLTKAPPRPLAVGGPVVWCDSLWKVAAPPRARNSGIEEIALWNEECGYDVALVTDCTRVQP